MATANKTILISGASRGIGLAIADLLRARGADVIGTSRTPQGDRADMLPLDVTDDASVAACVSTVIATRGRVDVLIANAGYDLYGAIEDTTVDEIEAQIDTNLMGVVRLIKAVLPGMRAQGSGRIIVMGSLGGKIGLPMNSAYAASKFALEGLCESLRLELAPLGIDVALICPPAVSTDTLDTSIRRVTHSRSPLAGRTDAMIAAMRKAGAESRITPQRVAETVAEIVFARRPLLHNPIGGQATWLPRLKMLLPQRIFEGMLRGQFP